MGEERVSSIQESVVFTRLPLFGLGLGFYIVGKSMDDITHTVEEHKIKFLNFLKNYSLSCKNWYVKTRETKKMCEIVILLRNIIYP